MRPSKVSGEHVDDRKPDGPEDHAKHECTQEPHVARERREAVFDREKAGVGERHRRDVYRLPGCFPEIEAGEEHAGKEQGGDDRLDGQHAHRYGQKQTAGITQAHRLTLGDRAFADSQRVAIARREKLLSQPEPAADDESEDRRQSEHADAADLDSYKDDDVAEGRPVGCHIDGRESRDADD